MVGWEARVFILHPAAVKVEKVNGRLIRKLGSLRASLPSHYSSLIGGLCQRLSTVIGSPGCEQEAWSSRQKRVLHNKGLKLNNSNPTTRLLHRKTTRIHKHCFKIISSSFTLASLDGATRWDSVTFRSACRWRRSKSTFPSCYLLYSPLLRWEAFVEHLSGARTPQKPDLGVAGSCARRGRCTGHGVN